MWLSSPDFLLYPGVFGVSIALFCVWLSTHLFGGTSFLVFHFTKRFCNSGEKTALCSHVTSSCVYLDALDVFYYPLFYVPCEDDSYADAA